MATDGSVMRTVKVALIKHLNGQSKLLTKLRYAGTYSRIPVSALGNWFDPKKRVYQGPDFRLNIESIGYRSPDSGQNNVSKKNKDDIPVSGALFTFSLTVHFSTFQSDSSQTEISM